MTKSKGVGRGGRRKGAGRPRFAKTGKTSYFSTRLTPETRELLEAEARHQGRSLSVVAEDLLQFALDEKRGRRNRPDQLRSLFLLIEFLVQLLPGPYQQDTKYSWRTNPYMFEAFRASVMRLIDFLRPPGNIVTPPPDQDVPFPNSTDEYALLNVERLLLLVGFHKGFIRMREEDPDFDFEPMTPEGARWHYGLISAAKHLNLPHLNLQQLNRPHLNLPSKVQK
jgi:hypothetical protein